MDLIYMNPSKEDIGVLKDYTLDMAFGSDENNFECTVSASNNVCEAGFYLYAEGTEYGGIIDSINVDTESETVIYKGRTWHGILDSKIFEPDAGNDYLVVKGEANTVLSTLISRMGLESMFKVSDEASGINISYKMNRYVSGYIGILRMLKASGAKLNVIFKNGFVELSAEPFVDYSKDEQFDTDQISFTIQKNYKPINHVICLGAGDLKDRRVIHLYADGVGNISGTQTFTGVDEMCVTYDYSNAESDEELIEGGVDIIKASWASDSIEFDFESDDESFDINDVIGAVEFTTGTEVKASITKKIIKIQDYTTSISYSCESGVGTVASSGYPSSGSGGSGGVVDAYTKAETDALLEGKSDTSHTHDDRYYTESEVDTKLAKYIPLTGSTDITGTLRTAGELQSTTANGLRLVQGNYGSVIRNDGTHTYLCITNAGDQYGSNWVHFPIYVTHSDGSIHLMNHTYSKAITAEADITTYGRIIANGAHFNGTVVIHSAELNGYSNALQIGDDCYIGDCNTANCIGLKGMNDNTQAFIRFGYNGATFGYGNNGYLKSSHIIKDESGRLIHSSNDSIYDLKYIASDTPYLYLWTSNWGAYGVNMWASDTRLKKNIEETDITALDKVKLIEFIQFDWKKNGCHVDIGVSANQLEEFMPDVVYEVEQGEESEFESLKNIDTGKMTTYALKAIQELNEIVEEQSNHIALLRDEINELKQQLASTK